MGFITHLKVLFLKYFVRKGPVEEMIKGVWRVLEEHLKGGAGALDVPMQLLPHLKQLLLLERQSTTDHLLPLSVLWIAWLVTFEIMIAGARILSSLPWKVFELLLKAVNVVVLEQLESGIYEEIQKHLGFLKAC